MGLWKSASIPLASPPGEAEALRSLTVWERVLFSGLVKRMEWAAVNVERTKARMGRDGFVSLVHLEIARELQLLGTGVGWGGIVVSLASWVTQAHYLWPAETLAYVSAVTFFGWDFFRLSTTARARRSFVAGGRVQEPLAQFGSPPRWRGVGLWGFRALLLEVFAIGIIFLNAAYTAPRVTGAFFLGMDWLLLLLATRFTRRSHPTRGPAGLALATSSGGSPRRPGGAQYAVIATTVYAVALFSVQSVLGHGLARDAASLATTTTTPLWAPAVTVPTPAGTWPPFGGDINEYFCETILADGLKGAAPGQSTSVAVSAFEMTAEATMNNPTVAFKWFQYEVTVYTHQVKALGRNQATTNMHDAVLGECPLLVSEGFTNRY